MAFFLKHTNSTNKARLKTTENTLVFDTQEKSQEEQDKDDTLHVSGTNQSLIDYKYNVPHMHCSHDQDGRKIYCCCSSIYSVIKSLITNRNEIKSEYT